VSLKFKILFFFFVLVLAGFFGFGENIYAANHVYISAVQIAGDDSDDDFIEIYNSACEEQDLAGWKLRKRIGSGSEQSIKELEKSIPAKGYFLWANSKKGFESVISADEYTKTILSKDYSLALFNDEGKQVDSVTWGTNANPFSDTIAGFNPDALWSLKRNGNTLKLVQNYSPKNSSSAFVEKDELAMCPEPEPKIYSAKIVINEFLPAPSSENEEYIELYNSTDENIDLSGYILKDASKSGKYIFPNNTKIKPLDYLVIYKKDFKFALNNSGEESITFLDPNKKIVSTVSYSGSKANVSYDFDGKGWRQSKFLTPGKKNKFNNFPEVKKKNDHKIYVGVYADFSAKGYDKDKDKLKFVWDFGDGHKSYKKETRHKFEKAGKYKVTLKVSDGSEDKIETFKVEVKKFPKSQVKILSVSPNPQGKDSENEYVVLQNKSKKKINLKDWSVATGNKNLYNHPISENIFIKPGQIFKLTRAESKFALNNKSAKIELRYPNGKVASKIAYDKKKESVAEDEIYTKESGQWAWVAPISTEAAPQLAIATAKPKNIITEPEIPETNIILASGKNFSEDLSKSKVALVSFEKTPSMVLGALTYHPSVISLVPQTKESYFEIIFTAINSAFNYLFNILQFK